MEWNPRFFPNINKTVEIVWWHRKSDNKGKCWYLEVDDDYDDDLMGYRYIVSMN